MDEPTWRILPAGAIVPRILEALGAEAVGATVGALPIAEADPAVIISLPAWVEVAALVVSGHDWYLWCEPHRAARAAGQCVLDLPPGRYLIDVFDTASRAWTSRESAAGSPLVAGIATTGRPVIAHIRRTSSSTEPMCTRS